MRDELVQMAKRMTRNDESAEDAVQDVMLRLWTMRSSLGDNDHLRNLAITILRNLLTDSSRRKRYEDGRKMDERELGMEDLTAEHNDEAALVRLIVDHLPPLQRQVFRLKEVEGYGSREIISIIGGSPESLRQNLSRARRKIREDFIRLTAMRVRRMEQAK